MTTYEFGQVVLVPFPFTDLETTKKRPAVIVSRAAYNRSRSDVVAMAVTSQLRPRGDFGETHVLDWERAGLLKPSVVKPLLVTVCKSMLLCPLGMLTGRDRCALQESLHHILEVD
ncbi:MAG: type II toxin-antitoxin system PemK/MazF family toxin [Myxococcota bacterium]